jgi:hypothetical protein
MKRDYNRWADELTHPNFEGCRPDRQLTVSEAFSPCWMTSLWALNPLGTIPNVIRPSTKPPKVYWSLVAAADFLSQWCFTHLNPFLDTFLSELIALAGWVDKMCDTTTVVWGLC